MMSNPLPVSPHIPPFLSKGQKVALVSPSGCIKADCVERARRLLGEWGLECEPGDYVLKQDGPCAGTDEQRLHDLQRALDDPSVRAVICTRGGYGLGRIIDRIDFSKFLENPKWVAGFSDITVLHSRLAQLGVASLHCVMPNSYSFSENSQAEETLRKALFGERLAYEISSGNLNRAGRVKASLTGGNLSMLYSQRGTPTDINPAGRILFMEDLGEYDYHIDRMLSNLDRGGWFAHLAGLIVGAFTDIKQGASPCREDVKAMIRRYTAPYRYPVCYDFPSGHISDNRALYLGVPACLEVGEGEGSLSRLAFLL